MLLIFFPWIEDTWIATNDVYTNCVARRRTISNNPIRPKTY